MTMTFSCGFPRPRNLSMSPVGFLRSTPAPRSIIGVDRIENLPRMVMSPSPDEVPVTLFSEDGHQNRPLIAWRQSPSEIGMSEAADTGEHSWLVARVVAFVTVTHRFAGTFRAVTVERDEPDAFARSIGISTPMSIRSVRP